MSILDLVQQSPILLIGWTDAAATAPVQARFSEPGHVVVLPAAPSNGALSFENNTFNTVAVADSRAAPNTILAELFRVVKPGGQLIVASAELESRRSDLILAGFTDIAAPESVSGNAVTATKPNYSSGQAFSLRTKKAVATAPVAAAAWTSTGDDELVDEDSLVDAESLRATSGTLAGECGPTAGRRTRACKNCSCGLAEREAAEEAAAAGTANPAAMIAKEDLFEKPAASACGSCYLGDAFRCPSCPYRGLPPFNPGEKISLKSDMLDSDL